MKISLLLFVLTFLSSAYSQPFVSHSFLRINATTFRVSTQFGIGMPGCFENQAREEVLSNDTLFLKIAFDMRVVTNNFGCSRGDTIIQTNFSSNITHVNVSTGYIRFNQQDPTLGDTTWSLYDSTFATTLQIPENPTQTPVFSVNEGQLTVHNESVTGIRLIDVNGKQLQISSNNILDISLLHSGVYLLQIFSGAGNVTVVRWMKE